MAVRHCLWNHRSFLIVCIAPIILLPLPIFIDDQKGTCGYMLLLMAIYWFTEALPLGVTGLIPVFLAPMFGILTTSAVCNNYLKYVTVRLTASLIVAIGIEKSQLHKRIALGVLKAIGTQPRSLMFGFMFPTWFLSMWMSNTAATAMMLPIMECVLEQLKVLEDGSQTLLTNTAEHNKGLEIELLPVESQGNGNIAVDCGNMENEKSELNRSENVCISVQHPCQPGEQEAENLKKYNNFCKGMTVAVAYAANVAGSATLTGTSVNIIMKGHADELWQRHGYDESPVTYATWSIYALPVAILNFMFVYIWLLLYYLGVSAFKWGNEDVMRQQAVKTIILTEYYKLGKLRFEELASGGLFFMLVLLWFFRSPGFMPGWSVAFKSGYISDAVPAVFIAVILFAIPMHIPQCATEKKRGPAKALMDWHTIHQKFPWSIIFLMGGGFSLAQACVESGLSPWIGDKLTIFGNLPDWLMVALICFFVALLTEMTSNSATCTLLMPIVASMAENLRKNPLYLMFPTSIATCYAFMLPVATPPNAIVFSYGRITILDMVKAGAILNVLCIVSITLANHTWGMAFFKLGDIPWDLNTEVPTTSMYNITYLL